MFPRPRTLVLAMAIILVWAHAPASEHGPGAHDAKMEQAGGMHGLDMSKPEGGMPDMDMSKPGHDHAKMMAEAAQEGPPPGVEERLGGMVADATFTDSQGNAVSLRQLASKPTLLLPVYYTCPDVCSILQGRMAQVLPQVNLTPGKDFQVVSLSFDENDVPETAARAKRTYLKATGGGFPAQDWLFLTGDRRAIAQAMDSIGFHFKRSPTGFAHPVVAVALAPGGKIVRYLYGLNVLPFDVTMAATEAAQGKVSLSVRRMLAFCFSYDPQGRRYVFNAMRVAGVSVLGGMAVLLGALLLAGRRKRKRR